MQSSFLKPYWHWAVILMLAVPAGVVMAQRGEDSENRFSESEDWNQGSRERFERGPGVRRPGVRGPIRPDVQTRGPQDRPSLPGMPPAPPRPNRISEEYEDSYSESERDLRRRVERDVEVRLNSKTIDPMVFHFERSGRQRVEMSREDPEARELAMAYRRAGDPEQKERLRDRLHQLTNEAFEKQIEQRRDQIEKMRRQLDEITERLERREQLRDQVIERRIAELLDQPDPLSWRMSPLPTINGSRPTRSSGMAPAGPRNPRSTDRGNRNERAEMMERSRERASQEASRVAQEMDRVRLEIERAHQEAEKARREAQRAREGEKRALRDVERMKTTEREENEAYQQPLDQMDEEDQDDRTDADSADDEIDEEAEIDDE